MAEVLTALAEDLDLSAAVWVFGNGEGTMRGHRKQEVAYLAVHSPVGMLAPGCVPAFTSDVLNHTTSRL